MRKSQIEEYYQQVENYHQTIEDSQHESFIVPPELLLQFFDSEGTIVDLAGGSGINQQIFHLQSGTYISVDLSLRGLRIAREGHRGMQLLASVESLPIRDGSVDTVLCSWSLEHMADPETVLNEMIRIVKPGGRILIWGPNWDNIFRKDFPQFVHKSREYVWLVRWTMFFRLIRNEFFPFHYSPYINLDVAALADSSRYLSGDTDAVHCVLCQETYKWFGKKGMYIVHISDFSEMGKHIHNGLMIRTIRVILRPLLPVLRRIPLVRWFVIRFPIVVEKPH
jgi:SAM-dependent methyltransferase